MNCNNSSLTILSGLFNTGLIIFNYTGEAIYYLYFNCVATGGPIILNGIKTTKGKKPFESRLCQ